MTSDEQTTRSEATDPRKPDEVADQVTHARAQELREEAAQPVRYLWPTLASLWQARAR